MRWLQKMETALVSDFVNIHIFCPKSFFLSYYERAKSCVSGVTWLCLLTVWVCMCWINAKNKLSYTLTLNFLYCTPSKWCLRLQFASKKSLNSLLFRFSTDQKHSSEILVLVNKVALCFSCRSNACILEIYKRYKVYSLLDPKISSLDKWIGLSIWNTQPRILNIIDELKPHS